MSERPASDGASDGDKLPWLEPYRDPGAARPRLREVKAPSTASPARPPAPRRRAIGSSVGGSVGAGLGLFAAAALALGGYWYGRQSVSDIAASDESGAIITPLPPVGSERLVLTYPTIEDAAPGERAGVAATSSDLAPAAAAPARAASEPAVRRPPPVRRNPVRSALNSKPPAPPVAAPPPPKPRVAASPASSATAAPARRRVTYAAPPRAAGKPGQIILLGYYATPRYADAARRRVVQRYTYLSGLPVVVAPIALGPGRGSMYALRLVAKSKSDARALCKNLKGIGYGCTVQ